MAGKFALIIANKTYDDPDLSRLGPLDVDIVALEEVLRNPLIGQFDEVTTLVDEGCTAVREAIAHLLEGKHERLLLLYFCGHALKVDDQEYWTFRDTDRARLAATAIDTAFLKMHAERSGLLTRHVHVVDSGRTGLFQIAVSIHVPGWGFSKAAQSIKDPRDLRFTHFLVDGLKHGAADRDHDGVITVDELYRHVREQVTGDTPGLNAFGTFSGIVVARNPLPARAEGAPAGWLPVPDEVPAVSVPPPAQRPTESEAVAGRLVDENVQFSVYRPPVVVPERWYPMLAFAHLSQRRPDAPDDEPDPIAEVHRQALQILGADADTFAHVTQDSRLGIPLDGRLRIVPAVPGIDFNPTERSFFWTESVHREEFRLRARRDVDGRTVRGTVSVFLDCVLVADVNVAIAVRSGAEEKPAPIHDVARPYRRIFASYSHQDAAIVSAFEQYARGFGDRYMRDVIDLRAGEVWNSRLAEMIEQADVFQLFWSWNAMGSPFVRAEWEHALEMNRAYFVRPVYWETPFPERGDLPPAELKALHFANVGTLIAAPPSPPLVPPAPVARAPVPPAPPRPFTPPTTMSGPSSGASGYPDPMPASRSRPVARTPAPPLDEEDDTSGDTAILKRPVEAPPPIQGTPPAKSTSMLTIAIAVALLLAFVVAKACVSF